MIGIKQIGIQKCQEGTSRGGLVNHSDSGSWGDRGRGNELQSALENGLSWVGDKVMNFGDYIDQGLSYLAGALPGGMTVQESLQDTKKEQKARNNGERGYINNKGQYVYFPNMGMPPSVGIPSLKLSTIQNKWSGFKKWQERVSKSEFDNFFSKLSDQQWDDFYNLALKENNIPLAQKIRDSHFRVKAPNSETHDYWFHSTDKNFTEFNMDAKGVYTTEPLKHVGTQRTAEDIKGKNMHRLFLNQQKSLETPDFVHESAAQLANELYRQKVISLEEFNQIRDMSRGGNEAVRKLLASKGIDGTRYINQAEGKGDLSRSFISPSQVKKADAVTRDNSGNIIPISKRDNFTNNDFRYIWTVPLFGTALFGNND